MEKRNLLRAVVLAKAPSVAQASDPWAILASALTLDIRKAFDVEPPPLDFVLSGLKAGSVAILASPGGLGKSFTALEVAMAVAAPGADAQLLELGIKTHGRVLMLNAEDPLDVLNERVYSIGQFLDEAARDAVHQRLTIKSLRGIRPNLLDMKWVDALSRACEGVRLCVIDTFSRFHSGDENSNADMGAVIGHAELITERTGACVLGLHHTSKNAAMNGQQASQQSTRGASAIVDNARWQGYLEGMAAPEAKKLEVPEKYRRHFVSFGISKQNYGKPVSPRWLAKVAGGVLLNCPEGVEMQRAVDYLTRAETGGNVVTVNAANDPLSDSRPAAEVW